MINHSATRGILYLTTSVAIVLSLVTFLGLNLSGNYDEWERTYRMSFWRETPATWFASADYDGWVETFGEKHYNYTTRAPVRIPFCFLTSCDALGGSGSSPHVIEGHYRADLVPSQQQNVLVAQAAVNYLTDHLNADFFVNASEKYALELARHEELLRYEKAKLAPFVQVRDAARQATHSRGSVAYFALLTSFATIGLWFFVSFDSHRALWTPLAGVAATASFLAGMSLVALGGQFHDLAFAINCDTSRIEHLQRLAVITGDSVVPDSEVEAERCHYEGHTSWVVWSVWIIWTFNMLALIVLLVEHFFAAADSKAGDSFGKPRGISTAAGAHARADSTQNVRP